MYAVYVSAILQDAMLSMKVASNMVEREVIGFLKIKLKQNLNVFTLFQGSEYWLCGWIGWL